MSFYKTSKFKYAQNFIFGAGAAIVLIGAATKLTHAHFIISADLWILIGLGTEAVLFLLSGLVPPHDDYHWEKLYPGLNDHEANITPLTAGGASSSKSLTKAMDEALKDAKIEHELLSRLGESMKSLSNNVSKMSEVADVAAATSAYTESAKSAADALASVKTAYTSAAGAMSKLASASEDSGKYHEQVQIVTKNLAALNAVYELELKDTDTHLKAMNKFYGNISLAMQNLDSSISDSEKYKNQINSLASNLEKLNNVYGNMLSAMRN
jgi:gliding motility-associated protein GldL